MTLAKNKKLTIYVSALLLASIFMPEDAQARGRRLIRGMGRVPGAMNRDLNQSSRWNSNSLNRSRSNSSRLGNTENRSESQPFNSYDTVREYQTTNSPIDRHIEGPTERGGDYSRDKSASYSKEDGYSKSVSMQGTTKNGVDYDHSNNVDYNQESGYSKETSTTVNNTNGEAFEHSHKTK
ncbi:MAG: hypothetical protein IPG59_08610 [Candidatus Melainabacteria bacterium]|nr:MAG: hypothetical protein IPG59_08610 [Candidatus Melainabacteria bacterium]